MAFSPVELARRTGDAVSFAAAPARVALVLSDLIAADGHAIGATLRCGVAVPANDLDRRMLVEVLLRDRDILLPVDAAGHLTAHLMAPARDLVRQAEAAAIFSTTGRADLLTALRGICERAAFACGIEIVGPVDLDLNSPTLAAAAQRAADRARAEADATDRAHHLHRVAELSAILKDTPPALVLQTVNEADRAMALSAMLAPADDRPVALLAVAGQKIVRWMTGSDATPVVVPMDDLSIGAFRSIQPIQIDGEWSFAIGGQNGVALVDGSLQNPQTFADPDSTSRLGFNAVVGLTATDEIWATHSERGIVRWRRSDPAAPPAIDPLPSDPAPGARNLISLSADQVAFCANRRVFVGSPAGIVAIYEAAADIIAIVPADRLLHVLHDDGLWVALERQTWRKVSQQATGGPISAAAGLPWTGGVRLLLARRNGPIECLGTQDTLITRYSSRHLGLRSVAATQGWVAGTTADRQRILVWPAADGRSPVAELHIASLTGHRVADVCFGQ
jgi:hypothetical protein